MINNNTLDLTFDGCSMNTDTHSPSLDVRVCMCV